MGLSLATAERWVRRWERQQERYAVDREERFAVIADLVELIAASAAHRSLIVDLGCGPGSLAARLARRLPDADIVAVDRDPLLLELARTHHADAARYVDAVIGEPGWTEALTLDRPLDAAVSTTALHYLNPDTLRRTYGQLASLLRPGGILVNGAHPPPPATPNRPRARAPGRRPGGAPRPGGPRPARTTHTAPPPPPPHTTPPRTAEHRGPRGGPRRRAFAHEDWSSWWAAIAEDPEMTDLFAEHRTRCSPTGTDNAARLSLPTHLRLLRQAGFAHAGPVWQYGDSCVVVAIR
ncbi:class I SAM-dependent methyltransferase [Streptomyces diastatochromogenes]|uniref:class I SAM-dependent methyltransferase n=1 Tax=Streptomyces diastatochromogenes TaxID=42236 RepID=UPI00364CB6C9